MKIRIVIAAAILLGSASVLFAQRWGSAGCFLPGTVAPAASAQSPAIYQWMPSPDPDDAGRVYLYRNGTQIGGWDYDQKHYRAYSNGVWGDVSVSAPITPPDRVNQVVKTPPAPKQRQFAAWETGGVDLDALGSHPERHSISGREVDKNRAFEELDSRLKDTSSKMWLLVIDKDKERRSKVIEDIVADPGLQPLLDRTCVKSYDPTHAHLRDRDTGKPMYVTTGEPTIYLLAQNGKVLHRQDDYRGKSDLQALRKADPAYDPAKDPDLRKKPTTAPVTDPMNAGPMLLLAAGAAVLFLKRRQTEVAS